MDKASRAIRRSGVKLLSMGAGFGELNVLLSDLNDVRKAAKTFMSTQHQAAQDMLKWSVVEENRAVQDVISHIAELYLVWTDVQKSFIDNLKEYRHVFEMVLEGEKQVAQAKDNFHYCTEKEVKVRKELSKCSKRASPNELRLLETRVQHAIQAKELASIEVSERVRENESVKLIRLKEGLLRMSTAYCEMAHKGNMVFTAQRNVVLQLPDVHGQPLETIQYSGARTTQYIVDQAREKIGQYAAPDVANDPPPPYTPPHPERPPPARVSRLSSTGPPERPGTGPSPGPPAAPQTYSTPDHSPRKVTTTTTTQIHAQSNEHVVQIQTRVAAASTVPRSHSMGEINNTDPPPTYASSISLTDNRSGRYSLGSQPGPSHTVARSASYNNCQQSTSSDAVCNIQHQHHRLSGPPIVDLTQVSNNQSNHKLDSATQPTAHSTQLTNTPTTSNQQLDANTSNTGIADEQKPPDAAARLRPTPSPRSRSSNCEQYDTAEED